MKNLSKKPTVENTYNLTIDKIKVINRELVNKPLFWRNNVIQAWCISNSVGTKADHTFGTDDSFWIGIYDKDAKNYAGEFRFSFSTYGGMCGYNFNKFFQAKDIECENDLKIQELFLKKINNLIDLGILG